MVQMALFQDKKKQDNLERVRSRLENSIIQFLVFVGSDGEFYAGDLLKSIASDGITCAPDSPGRIMRLMKRKGEIDYKVVSRKDSLYKLLAVH